MTKVPKNFKLIYSAEEIDYKVSQIAKLISNDFKDSIPILIGVLNGSFIFLADLARKIEIKVEIEFIRLKSYEGLKSTNNIKYNFIFKYNNKLLFKKLTYHENCFQSSPQFDSR